MEDSEGPKILLLDIETRPDLVWTWGVYEENAIEVKEHWQLLSFSAKWLHGDHVTRGLCSYKGYTANSSDEHLAKELWRLLDKADVVVGHNAKKFDIRKINARFIAHGLTPPSPYGIVDTKNEVKRVAGFSSNKLDWLCSQLHLGRKIEHQGFPLWRGCMNGDKGAWKTMLKYNRHDVILLERLYKLLLPWMNHPNVGMYRNGLVCRNCGSKEISWRGSYRNLTTKYHRYQCQSCGHWGRDTKNIQTIKPVV